MALSSSAAYAACAFQASGDYLCGGAGGGNAAGGGAVKNNNGGGALPGFWNKLSSGQPVDPGAFGANTLPPQLTQAQIDQFNNNLDEVIAAYDQLPAGQQGAALNIISGMDTDALLGSSFSLAVL